MAPRRIVLLSLACCLLLAVGAMANRGAQVLHHSDGDGINGSGLTTASTSLTANRKLLDRGENRPGGHHEDDDDDEEEDDDEDDDDDDDGDDDDGGSPPTNVTPGTNTSSSSCSLTTGGTVTTFSKCYNMGAGTTYFNLTGSNLSVGYKVKSSGWAALAVGQPHNGASAVWYTGSTTSTVTMNGYSSSSIASPSKIKFSDVKGEKSASGEYIVTFSFPWPSGASSIQVALGTGSGSKNKHGSTPRKYTLSKSVL